MRAALIVNPVSGLGTTADAASSGRVALADRLARDSDPPIDVAVTARTGHAWELAADFVSRGYSRIIAWGGDGTINEAAGPLIGTGATLGIVPSGTGDGLARGLGLPLADPVRAFAIASTGRAAAMDVGLLGDRHFLNIGGIGFDAAVATAFNSRTTRGKRGYIIDSLLGVWGYQSQPYRVEAAGRHIEGPCFVVAFANCRQYGSGIVIAPEADPADGELDMVLVNGGPPWRQLWRARRLGFRRMAPAEGVTRARLTSARVTGERMQAHVDGQTFEVSGTIEVGIRPKALLISLL